MNYTVHYKLTIRGTLTEDDTRVEAPTKHHAIEYVRWLINSNFIQMYSEDVHLDCYVIDEQHSPGFLATIDQLHAVTGESKDNLTLLLEQVQKAYTKEGTNQ